MWKNIQACWKTLLTGYMRSNWIKWKGQRCQVGHLRCPDWFMTSPHYSCVVLYEYLKQGGGKNVARLLLIIYILKFKASVDRWSRWKIKAFNLLGIKARFSLAVQLVRWAWPLPPLRRICFQKKSEKKINYIKPQTTRLHMIHTA